MRNKFEVGFSYILDFRPAWAVLKKKKKDWKGEDRTGKGKEKKGKKRRGEERRGKRRKGREEI